MDFWDRVRTTIDKGLVVSKEALGKAGETARDIGEKGVLKLEIRELENQTKELLKALGSVVYELLEKEGKASVTAKNSEVSVILEKLRTIEAEVAQRELRIEKLKNQENSQEK